MKNRNYASVPKGFALRESQKERLEIIYKGTGVGQGCLILFIVTWLTGWGFGCIFLLKECLSASDLSNGLLWVTILFWVFEIAMLLLFFIVLFGRNFLVVANGILTIETRVFRFKWGKKIIPINSMERFVQIKEMSEGFPSWGLQVESKEKTTVVFSYSCVYEESYWLGETLAVWTNVNFVALES